MARQVHQKLASIPLQPSLMREGGVQYRTSGTADAFEVWINVMEAVEALCPRWPERALTIGVDFRL